MTTATRKEIAPAIRAISNRMDNAHEAMIECLMNIGKITKEEAGKVFQAYRKNKIFKNDFVGGRMTVKHGAFLDAETIRHVAKIA